MVGYGLSASHFNPKIKGTPVNLPLDRAQMTFAASGRLVLINRVLAISKSGTLWKQTRRPAWENGWSRMSDFEVRERVLLQKPKPNVCTYSPPEYRLPAPETTQPALALATLT